jgi:hypothetical protein
MAAILSGLLVILWNNQPATIAPTISEKRKLSASLDGSLHASPGTPLSVQAHRRIFQSQGSVFRNYGSLGINFFHQSLAL